MLSRVSLAVRWSAWLGDVADSARDLVALGRRVADLALG